MSQERLRKLLVELDGEATIDEISNLAQKRYPNETLHKYLRRRLQSMEKKDLVVKKNKNGNLPKVVKTLRLNIILMNSIPTFVRMI